MQRGDLLIQCQPDRTGRDSGEQWRSENPHPRNIDMVADRAHGDEQANQRGRVHGEGGARVAVVCRHQRCHR